MFDTKPTILSIEHNGNKFTAELPWDADMEDLTNAFYTLCIGATFQPTTVIRGMKEFLEEMNSEE